MTTAFLTHPDALNHVNPEGHAECAARLEAVYAATAGLDLLRVEAPLAGNTPILRAHPQSYIDNLEAQAPAVGIVALDPDTSLSAGSMNAARRGVGGVLKAVELVLDGEAGNAFVAMRPPGHHAEREKSMGFCLFGNVAIAALHALEARGLSRVAIVDFDVHHGNGTQDILWTEPRIRYFSSHGMPLYPGTGALDERGAHGQIVNIPLPPGSTGALYREKLENIILPALDDFRPELLLISAGFDAHEGDPLANLNWQDEDFTFATRRLCEVAQKHCAGRVVSALEGGYNLSTLGGLVRAHIEVLQEFSA
ncbi:MAG: histone deacetylase family protein [Rhodobacteraceae bacterium]|nr:histone deacetylase family protein [Paracoccaceae bacterium]